MTVLLPTGSFGVGRDVPVNTRITPFSSVQTIGTTVWRCSGDAYVQTGPVYRGTLASTGMTYAEASTTFTVFKTNVAGVGLILRASSYSSGAGWYSVPVSGHGFLNSWASSGRISYTGAWSNVYFGTRLDAAYVKTGPITAGAISLGTVGQAAVSTSSLTPIAGTATIVASGSASFHELACTTPDVEVDLDAVPARNFAGVGTSIADKDFNITLAPCPTGMTSVRYRLDAAPGIPVINAAQGVIGLAPTSSATGVALQITNTAGAGMSLGTQRVVSDYNSGVGGDLVIPLRVHYYQTATTVTPGGVESSAVFTMTYL